MTPDERNLLNDLANKIAQTPAPPKDPEAEEFIRTRIGSRPDALYLMTQTVLVQNIALQNAQQQIQDLQARQGQPAGSGPGSFLGGSGRPQAYGSAAAGGTPYAPQYAPPSPQYAQPQPSGGMFGGGGGGSSFLRGAAQTAAGVAAGTLAAEAIGSMFSHHEGFGGSGLMGGAPVEETVVNNYYDNPPDDLRVDDRGGREGFADPGSNYDDTQYDDSTDADSLDDGGGFDDGGGNDDGF